MEPVIGSRRHRPTPSIVALDNTEWALIEDLFDPPRREGRPATYSRREMVEATLFLARTGCQWRDLPAN